MDLISGYKLQYDPFPVLDRLKTDRNNAIDELWENLYHQGDVGTASYAAVPRLVKHELLDVVAAIEIARNNGSNPPLPKEMEAEYKSALNNAISKLPSDLSQLKSFYAIHASVHQQHDLAMVLDFFSVEELVAQIE